MPDYVGLLMLALATWRVSVLLVRERGPWDLALRLRRAAGIVHDDNGDPVGVPERMPGAVFGCVWCTSLWVVWPLLVVWVWTPVLVVGLAVAGGAVIIELVTGGLTDAR